MRVGHAADARTIRVDVPAGDLLPWDLDTEYRVVGTDLDRIDAVAKVTGRARYAYDVNRPGMLHAVMVRSPHAHGKLTALDLERARSMPGVRAVIATKEIGHQVRFVGDPVAAIAADRIDQARDAIEAVRAEYEVDADAPITLDDAEGAPQRNEAGEVVGDWPEQDAGKLEQALGECAAVREATYTVEVQTHSCLETHGLVAEYRSDDGGSLEAWASTQATFGVRQGLARALDLPEDRVRVHAEFIGGGFGSKFSPDAEGVAAARLSRETGAPVKLMLSRFEEHTCAGNRPSAIVRVRAGVDGEGTIRAWDWRCWGGPGYSGSGGSTRFVGSYLEKAAVRNVQSDLTTFTDAGRAMRAPGYPQGHFIAEGMLDELAEAAGMDPLAFRLKNDADTLRQTEWKLGAERFGWSKRYNTRPGQASEGDDPRRLRGAGLAAAFWGQMGRPGNQVTCRIHQDGRVEARNGAQDIGTGMKTVMALITAEELGIEPARVKVVMGDTAEPVGPASGGSVTTPSLAPTIRQAAALAREELAERLARARGVDASAVRFVGGKVVVGDDELSFESACKAVGPNPVEATGRRFPNYDGYKDNVCGCQFAEVEVDRHTGVVRVLKMLAVQDCGLVIAKKLAESQVLGAMIQGIGYALHEQRILDSRSGRMLNGDLSFYKVPGTVDVLDLEAMMYPVANGKNNVGAAGLGEPPATAAPAAIANAVSNAIGVRMRSLPITPDKVLAALAAKTERK
jgi:xanthine dehydrogenase YagR molybdenum-binding subunit